MIADINFIKIWILFCTQIKYSVLSVLQRCLIFQTISNQIVCVTIQLSLQLDADRLMHFISNQKLLLSLKDAFNFVNECLIFNVLVLNTVQLFLITRIICIWWFNWNRPIWCLRRSYRLLLRRYYRLLLDSGWIWSILVSRSYSVDFPFHPWLRIHLIVWTISKLCKSLIILPLYLVINLIRHFNHNFMSFTVHSLWLLIESFNLSWYLRL